MSSHDDRTEARVRAAFAAELRRAEADAELGLLRITSRSGGRSSPVSAELRRRHRALTAGLLTATAAGLVVVAIGVGLFGAGVRNAVPAASSSSVPTTVVSSPHAASPSATPSIPRYGDGIPMTWQGQPVLRWADALAMRTSATDDTPFLVGVWLDVNHGLMFCPSMHGDPSAPDSWVNSVCTGVAMSAEAGAGAAQLDAVATFHFASIAELSTGPAILHVHVHDPRAGQCGYQQAICADMIVVDNAAWTGDATTDPHPLGVDQVMAAATRVSPASGLLQPSQSFGCGAGAMDGLMLCPPVETGVPYASQIAGACVFPSSEALARALPKLTPGVDGALLSYAVAWTEGGSFGLWDYRWLVVDNVAILVRTAVVTPSQSDIQLLNQLQSTLKALEAGPSPVR
jgi:hypothetical protein